MASSEPFLPVPTEDPETGSEQGHKFSSVPTYSPTGSGQAATSTPTTASATASATGAPVSFSIAATPGDERVFSDNGGGGRNPRHSFCGVCCDMRRAVLAVNAATIAFRLATVFLVALLVDLVPGNLGEIEAEITDDEVREEFDEFVGEGGLRVVEGLVDLFATVSIAFHACGIYGALAFREWGILTAGFTYAVACVASLLVGDSWAFFWAALCLYPHAAMYRLMREGVMTDYNYHRIAHCCGERRP